MQAGSWFPNPISGPGFVGALATLGAVAAGAAIIEAALIPGLLIGGAAVLAPRLLPRDVLSGLGNKLRRTALSLVPATSAASARPAQRHAIQTQATQLQDAGEPAGFDAWRAVVKTFTYRVIVTTVDFGANYFVIGELATAAGLSSLSLVAGPIFYFAHEAAWHYYGPASTRKLNPLEANALVPVPGVTESQENGQTRFARVKVSRALAKTVTYEGVTAVSEFSVNYLFVRDLANAAGLTAFSVAISPFIYYAHEKAWDYFDAAKVRSPAEPAPKLLPAAA